MKHIKNFESFSNQNNEQGLVKKWLVDVLEGWNLTFSDDDDDDDDDSGEVYELIEKIESDTLSLHDCGEVLFHLYQNFYNIIADEDDENYNEELASILCGYEQPNVESKEEYETAINTIYELVK